MRSTFLWGGYNFRLPPLKVRDLRLDLEKTISFSDKPWKNGCWVDESQQQGNATQIAKQV